MRRQMRRAQLAAMHNKRVMDAGALGAGSGWLCLDVRSQQSSLYTWAFAMCSMGCSTALPCRNKPKLTASAAPIPPSHQAPAMCGMCAPQT